MASSSAENSEEQIPPSSSTTQGDAIQERTNQEIARTGSVRNTIADWLSLRRDPPPSATLPSTEPYPFYSELQRANENYNIRDEIGSGLPPASGMPSSSGRQRETVGHQEEEETRPGAVAVFEDTNGVDVRIAHLEKGRLTRSCDDGGDDETEAHPSNEKMSDSMRNGQRRATRGNDNENELIFDVDDEYNDGAPLAIVHPPIESRVVQKYTDEEAEIQRRTMEEINMRSVDALEVTIASDGSGRSTGKAKLIQRAIILGLVCLVVTVVGVTLGFDRRRHATEGNMIPTSPTPAPTQQVTIMYDYLYELILPISGEEALRDESSHRYKALDWLASHDPLMMQDQTSNRDPSLMIERYIVALIYFTTGGPDYWLTDKKWLTKHSVCDWDFIDCNEELSVTAMHLGSNNLTGTLPNELSYLSSLQDLSIWFGNLHGTIPESYGNITLLESFSVARHQLTGSIPTSLSQLRRLKFFFLGDNILTGTIPSLLFTLPSLRKIDVDRNILSGTIPEFSPSVIYATMDDNLLEGSIPESIYLLSDLYRLYFADNFLSGTISPNVMRLAELEVLYLGGNAKIGGILPSEIGTLTKLEHLRVDNCNFEGTIPTQFGNMESMWSMRLERNRLSGTVPLELGNIQSLAELFLGNNDLTGSLSSNFLGLRHLGKLDVRNTSLTSDGVEAFCEEAVLHTEIYADCAGPDPEVTCPCCVECCDDLSGECNKNLPGVCQVARSNYEYENGKFYDERRNTTCECTDDGHMIVCSDESCPSCNEDGSICALSTNYGTRIDDNGDLLSWHGTFRYLNGITRNDGNDDVVVSLTWDNNERECEVTINNEVCLGCELNFCFDNFRSYKVFCENIEGAGNIDLCDEYFSVDAAGPLTVFAMTDPRYGSGCHPRSHYDENW